MAKIKKNEAQAVPCLDHNSRTCIEVSREDGKVHYLTITLDVYDLIETSVQSFDARFKPIKDYPSEKACQLFVEYMRRLGATERAVDALGKFINISNDIRSEIMAAAKKRAVPAGEGGDAKPKKSKTPAKKVAATKAKASKATKPKREPGAPRESAAQLFQDLIMKGTMTDDAIFKKVQEKYGLDDNKRSYVAWYRNKMKKDGKNPPDAK